MVLTILTPAFNRRDGVLRLFDSLCMQSDKRFEWLIVDDGSTDDTRQWVEKIQKESPFPIRYIYKENGGKHTALNVGISLIDTQLTFIVDSDDVLTSDAVEVIFHYNDRYKNKNGLCGYTFLRAFPDGRVNGKLFEPDEKIASYIEARINCDDTLADKAEVYFTQCLKEFPFPEYNGERFLGEDIVWVPMGRKYDMVHINKAIYIGNYENNGLTQNRRKHNIHSPVGCMHRAEELMKKDIKWIYRIKAGLQYIIYGRFAKIGVGRLLRQSEFKLLSIMCLIPGLILYAKWKHSEF